MARAQHSAVAAAIESMGIEAIVLEAAEDFPDSVFIEDAVVILGDTAILCPSSRPSRRGEEDLLEPVLARLGLKVMRLERPATVDGGDCIVAGKVLFVGLSTRTNEAACNELRRLCTEYDVIPTVFKADTFLHLKSAATYIGDRTFLVAPDSFPAPPFTGYELVEVPPNEAFAANCVVVGMTALVPSGAPRTSRLLADFGLRVVELDISEFIKGDGSLSCLSVICETEID